MSAATVVDIGELARQLHARERESLEIALPADSAVPDTDDTPGVSVRDGRLCFASLADRNRLLADWTLRSLGARACEPAALLEAAYELWKDEIGHADTACGRLLCSAQARVDVPLGAAQLLQAGAEVFRISACMEAMLDRAEALPLDSVVALGRAIATRTAGTGGGGAFFAGVTGWIAARPTDAQSLAETLAHAPEEASADLLGAAWMAWFEAAPQAAAAAVAQMAAREEPALHRVCAWTARRMLEAATLPDDSAAALDRVILTCMASDDPAQRGAGLQAAAQLLHRRRGFDAALRERLVRRDPDSLAHVANALAMHARAHLEAQTFFDWLEFCIHLPAEARWALGSLDSKLAQLLARPDPGREAVLRFLGEWIAALPPAGAYDRRFVEAFQGCASAIVRDEALLARVVTQWLLHDVRTMPAAAAALLSEIRHTRDASLRVRFDALLLDASPDGDLAFLARRLIGFVIDAPQLLSLALSLLAVQDAPRRVHPLLATLLGDEIGYDYPGTTIERLKVAGAAAQPQAKALLDAIRQKLEVSMASIESLPRLKELSAPASLRRDFARARGRQMYEAMREAQKDSLFALIATQVHVKAGSATFQYLDGQFTEPNHMKPTSMSAELPRRETLDPVGNAFRMHLNRSAKRSKP